MSEDHHKIHYIELPALSVAAMKDFYGKTFGWTFTDYGPQYAAFHGGGLRVGLRKARIISRRTNLELS